MPGGNHGSLFRHSSREVVDGSMLILPRACLEKGKELKWTAQQRYHESITFSFSQFLEVRRWWPNGNSAARLLGKYEDLERAALQKWQ